MSIKLPYKEKPNEPGPDWDKFLESEKKLRRTKIYTLIGLVMVFLACVVWRIISPKMTTVVYHELPRIERKASAKGKAASRDSSRSKQKNQVLDKSDRSDKERSTLSKKRTKPSTKSHSSTASSRQPAKSVLDKEELSEE